MMGVRGDDRMISTITTGALPVYQDPQELKRKRNRLAQRKHRSREPSPEHLSDLGFPNNE